MRRSRSAQDSSAQDSSAHSSFDTISSHELALRLTSFACIGDVPCHEAIEVLMRLGQSAISGRWARCLIRKVDSLPYQEGGQDAISGSEGLQNAISGRWAGWLIRKVGSLPYQEGGQPAISEK